MQTGLIERFNGKFRECLNAHWITSLAQAREVIAYWRRGYNQVTPHSGCGRIPPAQFSANCRHNTSTTQTLYYPGLHQQSLIWPMGQVNPKTIRKESLTPSSGSSPAPEERGARVHTARATLSSLRP